MAKEIKTKERIEWIDLLKGVGIILVLLGHAIFPQYLRIILYSFHMPLFFFLSGITLNVNIEFKSYMVKRVRGILVPLVFFSIIHITVCDVLYNAIVGGNMKITQALSNFPGIILQFREGYFSTAFWYLICLFVSEVTLYFICKLSEKIQRLIILVGLVLTYLYLKYIGILLPWCLEITFVALTFMCMGRYYTNHKEVIDKFTPLYSSIVYAFICISTAIINANNFIGGNTVNMADSSYGNFSLFFISATSGILMLLSIFKNLDVSWRSVRYIGRNSIIYYCLHEVIFIIPQFVAYHFFDSLVNVFGGQLIIGFGYLIFTLPIIYFVSIFINKKIPFVLGKTKTV